ncbi:MAG: sigma-70 family RNA polymerase sigma factor [Verrucomicrobiota bacterium]|nr:sigma-70 family RNA polymerase sigma factor [Verrucomicrobiota bacterium]
MVDRNDPDVALMLRVKEGDLSAYEMLVEQFKQPVMNLLHRLIGDPDEAEDIAQNVFLQVWKTRERYEPASKFTTWLFTIARNLGLNEIRRRARHPADSLDESRPDNDAQPIRIVEDSTSSIPADASLSAELRAKVEEALMDLPEKQRTALMLCRDGGVSYEEIAEVLGGISLTAVKSIIFRGRAVLKNRLKPYLKSGEWHKK